MAIFGQIIFWGSVLGLAQSYVIYPFLMRLLAMGKKPNAICYAASDSGLPEVAVLMSVYNEERVIAEKLACLKELNYPAGKLRFYIGSDCSDDRTEALIREYAHQFPAGSFHFFPFPERRGKPPVINELAERALAESTPVAGVVQPGGPLEIPGPLSRNTVFLLTDASVMLQPDTLYRLVRHFKNPKIGVVDANMRNTGLRTDGISRSEQQYLGAEVRLKHWESLAWGMMIGPFGGCYALRAELFEPVPANSLVDDFWLVFRALEKGYAAINDLEAVCLEGATHRVSDEYRRKKRIAAGSFQNLARFRRWVLPPVTRLGFAFFCHKVLRWFGGFFLLAAYLALAGLALANHFYGWLFCFLTFAWLSVLALDFLQNRFGVRQSKLIKNLAYFLTMNLALMDGFFKWLGGIRENTWQRTNRT